MGELCFHCDVLEQSLEMSRPSAHNAGTSSRTKEGQMEEELYEENKFGLTYVGFEMLMGHSGGDAENAIVM